MSCRPASSHKGVKPAIGLEDRDFAHDVGCGPPIRGAGLTAGEVDANRLPVKPGAAEE